MTDEIGAVDAAAAETAAPVSETTAPPEPAAPEPSARHAVERAFDAWDEAETGRESDDDDEDDPKAAKDGGPKRAADGKFESADPEKVKAAAEAKAKEAKEAEAAAKAEKEPADAEKAAKPEAEKEKPAAPVREAPQRFSPEAKEAWKDAPEAVRTEVERAVTEMEKGLQQYQQRAEALKPFEEYSAKFKMDLPTALTKFAAANELLNKDFVGGVRQLAQTMGANLEDVAFALLDGDGGSAPQTATAPQNDAAQAKIAALEQQLSQVQQFIGRQQHQTVAQRVDAFAADHPRFDELSPTIARLMQTGMVERGDLDGAYQMAERLSTAPAAAPAPEPTPATAPAPAAAAQTRPRPVSISGSSGTGSDPARRKPANSAKEAFERAFNDV